MIFKSFVKEAALYAVCCLPLAILIVMLLWYFPNHAKVYQSVANEVANEVVNNTANSVTTIETEIYRVVCVEEKTGYCKEYSVRRITKE